MQILKQFGFFLFQTQTCSSYLSCRGASITEYAFDNQSPAPPFCKKNFF